MTRRQEAVLGAPALLVGEGGAVHAASVDLGWDIADPLAVRLIFHVPGTDSQEWIAARDLIADGINSPDEVGDGDLHLRGNGAGSTAILLRREGTSEFAELLVANEHLARFIGATEDACPAGGNEETMRAAIWVNTLLMTWGMNTEDAA